MVAPLDYGDIVLNMIVNLFPLLGMNKKQRIEESTRTQVAHH
jgi:hypothetical protein